MRFLWLLSILLAGILVMSVMADDAEGGESGESGNAEGGESAAAGESGESGESDENEESDEDEEEPCNKLHAAFTFRETDFFVYGDNKLAGFSFKGERWYSGHVEHIGFNDTVTSAYGDVYNHLFFLQSGRAEQGYHKFGDESVYTPVHYSGADLLFAENPDYAGIDAAFMRGSHHVVYLAGCEYAVVDLSKMEVVHSGNSEYVGIPCHPDAAWSSPNLRWAFITKGDKVYPLYWLDYHVRPEESLYKGFPYLKALNLCSE